MDRVTGIDPNLLIKMLFISVVDISYETCRPCRKYEDIVDYNLRLQPLDFGCTVI